MYSKSRNILQFCNSCFHSECSDEEIIEMKRQKSSTGSLPRKMSLRTCSRLQKCVCESTPKAFKVPFYSLMFEDSESSIIVETKENDQVSVYSTLISAISQPMFETFLSSRNKKVKLDISRSMLKLIMDIGYSGNCNIEDEDFDEVLSTAHKFKILHLGQICGETVMSKLTDQNALDSYRKSSKFLCEHYTNRVKKFILRQFPDIVRLDSFKVKIHYFLILESEELLTE